jgi:hypothetical protein
VKPLFDIHLLISDSTLQKNGKLSLELITVINTNHQSNLIYLNYKIGLGGEATFRHTSFDFRFYPSKKWKSKL